MRRRKREHGQAIRDVLLQPLSQGRHAAGILLNGFRQLGISRVAVGSVVNGAQIFSRSTAHRLAGDLSTRILLQMELAALPGNATKDGDASGVQTGMVIAGDARTLFNPRTTRLCRKVRQWISCSLKDAETPGI